MCIPPKVKNFVWRFARNALPTGDHLSTKSEKWTDKCPFCDLKETQGHLFGECAWVSRLWRRSGLIDCFLCRGNADCYDWFFWMERNAHLFNGSKLPEDEIVGRAYNFLEDYRAHQKVQVEVENNGAAQRDGWKKPQLGEVKINSDAGVLRDGGTGLGVVIRGADGKFILAAARNVRGEMRPDVAEAYAAELGARLGQQCDGTRVVLETNCLSLINQLDSAEGIQNDNGVICRSIRRQLAQVNEGRWQFVSREGNEAGHIMAHTKTRWNETIVWTDHPPFFLVDQLAKDNVTMRAD
ncbi:unnamed protein product [Linum trigynum]|uniref:RNase H type-1 domain-containing protein n=1 Tax=Linum trigynum TaxID=586398 RepID=A0AAV2ETR9_9ROSI